MPGNKDEQKNDLFTPLSGDQWLNLIENGKFDDGPVLEEYRGAGKHVKVVFDDDSKIVLSRIIKKGGWITFDDLVNEYGGYCEYYERESILLAKRVYRYLNDLGNRYRKRNVSTINFTPPNDGPETEWLDIIYVKEVSGNQTFWSVRKELEKELRDKAVKEKDWLDVKYYNGPDSYTNQYTAIFIQYLLKAEDNRCVSKDVLPTLKNKKGDEVKEHVDYFCRTTKDAARPRKSDYSGSIYPNYFYTENKKSYGLTGSLGNTETKYDVLVDYKAKVVENLKEDITKTKQCSDVEKEKDDLSCVIHSKGYSYSWTNPVNNIKVMYFGYKSGSVLFSDLGFGFREDMYTPEDIGDNGTLKNLKLGVSFESSNLPDEKKEALKNKWIFLHGENSVDGEFLMFPGKKVKKAEEYKREDGSTGKIYYNTLLEVLKEIFGDGRMTPKELTELVEARKQLILNGAPGTGKTYTADIIAKMIVLGKTEEEVKNLGEEDEKQIRERIQKVQFHPGYDYSDFIIGLKPVLIQDDKTIYTEPIRQPEYEKNEPTKLVERKLKEEVALAYAWQNGVFKEFADKAAENKKEKGDKADNFVFIIDEINRADLSNVFGEAFSILEKDYRGNEVILPSGHKFTIPDNLYIIGTMNDIDRSVESMDFALRRRFAWYEIEAEESAHIIQDKVPEDKREKFNPVIEALQVAMTKINEIIAGKNEGVDNILKNLGLGTEYQLGGAYFAPDIKDINPDDIDQIKKIRDDLWNHHIKVILNDYLRGNKNKKGILDGFKGIYGGPFEKWNEEQNEETLQPSEGTGSGKQEPDAGETTEE